MASYEDFITLELKVARIVSAERVEGSEKLLRLMVDVGEDVNRQILAGIGKRYQPEELIDRRIVIVANLEPRMLMGFESQGMLLAASSDHGPALLSVDDDVAPGSSVK